LRLRYTAGSTPSLVSAASDATAGGIDNRLAGTLVMRNSVVSDNRAVVNSTAANHADGGGISSTGARRRGQRDQRQHRRIHDLTLERTVVNANSAWANSAAAPMPFGGVASAFGGGISNGAPGIPAASLVLTDSVVNASRVSGSPGIGSPAAASSPAPRSRPAAPSSRATSWTPRLQSDGLCGRGSERAPRRSASPPSGAAAPIYGEA
jgi:hypothetical protein